MTSRKTKYYRRKKYSSLKTFHKSRANTKKYSQRRSKKNKRGGGSGNPLAIVQYQTPLTYSGNAGWYGVYPRSSDQILYQQQNPKMSYSRNLSLANEPIPGVNIAYTAPLRQTGGNNNNNNNKMLPLVRQDSDVLGQSQLSEFYPGPGHY